MKVKTAQRRAFPETTPFLDKSSLEDCLLGFEKKKRQVSTEARAPKTAAVETRASSRQFIELERAKLRRHCHFPEKNSSFELWW